jgi:hypothetical protein
MIGTGCPSGIVIDCWILSLLAPLAHGVTNDRVRTTSAKLKIIQILLLFIFYILHVAGQSRLTNEILKFGSNSLLTGLPGPLAETHQTSDRHSEPFARHPKPFARHPERSEGSLPLAQGKLREGSLPLAQGKLREGSQHFLFPAIRGLFAALRVTSKASSLVDRRRTPHLSFP